MTTCRRSAMMSWHRSPARMMSARASRLRSSRFDPLTGRIVLPGVARPCLRADPHSTTAERPRPYPRGVSGGAHTHHASDTPGEYPKSLGYGRLMGSMSAQVPGHVHVTEREGDGTWEDCAFVTAVEMMRTSGRSDIPATHAEAERLRAASGLPEEHTGASIGRDSRRRSWRSAA